MTNHDTQINGNTTNKVSFKFDESFDRSFKSMIESFDKSLDKLNNLDKHINQIETDYGICNCSYKMRYITPSDVSTYVSYLIKAFNHGLLSKNTNDVEMFTVAIVKQFIDENGCVPFESSSIMGNSKYLNPKTATLKDLILVCENDVYDKQVYSSYELHERLKAIKKDIDVINDMHFVANMKNIVKGLPAIMNDNDQFHMCNFTCRKVLTSYIESFILFTCTLNEVTVQSLIEYGLPKASYCTKNNSIQTKNEDEYDGINASTSIHDVVTECCLLRTNNFVIRNKIPFNCNMRDVVLQDMHPKFKDTESALHFIMTDDRSPIHTLLVKYVTDEHDYEGDYNMISRMFIGRVITDKFVRQHGCDNTNDMYDKVGFNTDVNWLDKIAYGNNYLDGNYRNDANGNHRMHPITNSLEMIYRIFGGCDLRSNEELANNIRRVSRVMIDIIYNYSKDGIENWQLVKDILCVLGEILTRNMLKLYNNNTQVFVYDDQMEDTMIPGFLYAEGFVMEADDNKPSVTFDNNPNVQNQSNIHVAKQKISEIIRKFLDWISRHVATIGSKFYKDHKIEMDWIKKNDALNKEIETALGKDFKPHVSNFPLYDIPAQELGDIKVDEVVNKWLNSKDPIDSKTIKAELYPGGDAIAKQIAGMEKEADVMAALTNYILYKQIKAKPGYNGELRSSHWKELVDDLTNSGRLIESITKNISDDLKKACNALQNKARQEENNIDNKDQRGNDVPSENRAQQLFNIVQQVSKTYYVTLINVLRSKFYATSYKLYREIVTGYQQSKSNAKNSNGQNSSTDNGVTNKTENNNNGDLQTPNDQ